MDIPHCSDGTARQMDGKAGWWITSGKIGLTPLARVKGMGRQHQYWGKPTTMGKAIPLIPPSATLLIQYHTETSAGQHIMYDPEEVTVNCGFIKLLNQDPMVYCVVLCR